MVSRPVGVVARRNQARRATVLARTEKKPPHPDAHRDKLARIGPAVGKDSRLPGFRAGTTPRPPFRRSDRADCALLWRQIDHVQPRRFRTDLSIPQIPPRSLVATV